jgi:hypothetical protein
MTKNEALTRLRAREPDLRALGIEHLSIFGSTARGEDRTDSDLDLAARLSEQAYETMGVFEYLAIEEDLASMLGIKVDLVTEPSHRPRLQAQIDRDRVNVF